MSDLRTALIDAHRKNLNRYYRLLATQLSDLERQYIHKRIAEARAELDRLLQARDEIETATADTVVAAHGLNQRGGGHFHV